MSTTAKIFAATVGRHVFTKKEVVVAAAAAAQRERPIERKRSQCPEALLSSVSSRPPSPSSAFACLDHFPFVSLSIFFFLSLFVFCRISIFFSAFDPFVCYSSPSSSHALELCVSGRHRPVRRSSPTGSAVVAAIAASGWTSCSVGCGWLRFSPFSVGVPMSFEDSGHCSHNDELEGKLRRLRDNGKWTRKEAGRARSVIERSTAATGEGRRSWGQTEKAAKESGARRARGEEAHAKNRRKNANDRRTLVEENARG